MRNILIGGAWPYANGSLHIGHIAGLLPGDVLARYHRAAGDRVYYVSGSDCHGTPVAIRAKQEERSPQEISDCYHEEFCECFEKLGFSYDVYTKTSSAEHKEFVRKFHEKLYKSEYVYEKEIPQAYCECCGGFLADRFVVGKCPECGSDARGDQCDVCGAVLEPERLLEAKCTVCNHEISFQNTTHLYIAISKLKKQLETFLDEHGHWRKNAIAFTKRYIDEGLRDRALTRNLDWGIEVPKEGYEDKRIYIWAENVLGYLSASYLAANGNEKAYRELWQGEAKHYYVHGKDNIPFHTIILPSLLLAHSAVRVDAGNNIDFEERLTGSGWHLPDEIISSEYLTLEGRKISTSQNYAIWARDIVDRYHPDSLRYYFLINGPEKKDADFSWREYVNSHNGELLGAYGNFVNRTLVFIHKYWKGVVPEGELCLEINRKLDSFYSEVGRKLEAGRIKEPLEEIFDFVRYANKFFDIEKPWVTVREEEDVCRNTLYNCVQIIANLAVLLQPFLPFSSREIFRWLNINEVWEKQFVPAGYQLPEIKLLFERLDKGVVEEESEKLSGHCVSREDPT